MSYATIDDLRSQLGSKVTPQAQQRYAERMLHQVPDAPVVDRAEFILDHCRGKRVLDFGASGAMHQAIRKAATAVLGVDRASADDVIAFDLDDVAQPAVPVYDAEVVVCGEVLEHLSNPGWFLHRLRAQYAGVTTILTVPNAFSSGAAKQMQAGIENVNLDHVAWYSFFTMKALLRRAGYTELWFGWYHGEPRLAEGLIVVTR